MEYLSIFETKTMTKVIHVHLCGKRKDYYFGSISAIFTKLTPGEIGFTKNYLLHAGLSGNGTITSNEAIIKQAELIRIKK